MSRKTNYQKMNDLRPNVNLHAYQKSAYGCLYLIADSPSKNTGVGCHALLQGIFPTQGLNPGLLHCKQILYCLSHQGSPKNIGVGSHSILKY